MSLRVALGAAALILSAACASSTSGRLAGEQWVDGTGDPLPTEAVNVVQGPAHCDWQSALVLTLAWPLGTTGGHRLQFARDPDGVLPAEPIGPLELNTTLPRGAVTTDWRIENNYLYLSPQDPPDAVYLLLPSGVERWPRLASEIACG